MSRLNYEVRLPESYEKLKRTGLCPVCGKAREEFEKGRKIYCSKACSEKSADYFLYWSSIREEIIDKSSSCALCGLTREKWEEKKKQESKAKFEEFSKRFSKEIEAWRAQRLAELEERFLKDIQELENLDSSHWGLRHFLEQISGEKVRSFDDFFPGFEVDHIVAIVNGGDQWDKKNLQVLCHDCHIKKTKEDLKAVRK